MKEVACNDYWVGVDLSADWFDASVAPRGTEPGTWRKLPVRHFENTRMGQEACVAWAQAFGRSGRRLLGLCVESTGRLSERFAREMQQLAPALPAVSIINPKRSRDFGHSLGVRDKTDPIDARILALYGATVQPQPKVLAENYRRLRELVRLRNRLGIQRDGLRDTQRQTDDSMVGDVFRRCLETLQKQMDRIEAEAQRILDADPQLQRDFELLDSVKGIGFITAWTLMAELGDLRAYSRGQLIAFVGLYPRRHKSGKSVEKKPRLVKGGQALVRKELYNAARSICHSKDNTLKDYLDRLEENGKIYMERLTAVMRKLLLIARSVLIQGKFYDRHFGQIA